MKTRVAQDTLMDKILGMPSTIQLLIPIILGLLIFFVIFGIEGQMRGGALQRAIRRENVLRQSFENQARQLSQLTQLRKTAVAMQAQLNQILKRFPTKTQMDQLLKNITKVGHESGVSFVFFKPMPPKTHEFYATSDIKIAVLGDYHQMANFMSHIANMKQLITVHDFRIKRENPKKAVLTMHVTIRVYHFTQQESEK